MLVTGNQTIQFNRLRAAFPQRIKAPFGYTDFLGEYASSGMPRVSSVTGDLYSGNDPLSSGDQSVGGMEFDALLGVVYPRAVYVPHLNAFAHEDYADWAASTDYGYTERAKLPVVVWTTPLAGIATGFDSAPSAGFQSGNDLQNGGCRLVEYQAPFDGVELYGFSSSGTLPVSTARCQGFTAFVNPAYAGYAGSDTLSLPGDTAAYTSDETTRSPKYSLCWRVGGSTKNGSGGVASGSVKARWYAVTVIPALGTFFQYNDATNATTGLPVAASWVTVDRLKDGGGGRAALLDGSAPESVIEVRVLGGMMRVMVGSDTTPFLFPLPDATRGVGTSLPLWYVDAWQVVVTNGRFLQWGVNPLKFLTAGSIVSNEINVGQIPDAAQLAGCAYRVHFAPATARGSGSSAGGAQTARYSGVGFVPVGSSATAATFDLNGTILRYKLGVTNTASGSWRGASYADTTACVRAVSLDIPPRDFTVFSAPTVLGTPGAPPMPASVDISHRFNLQTLTIDSSCSMTWSNFRGDWTNDQGTGVLDTTGHFAVSVDLGTSANLGTQFREFTGIANTNFENDWGGGGRDYVRVGCADLFLTLDVPVWNVPWLDGWNVYSAVYYLASLGGLTDAQMAFASFVPVSPYDPSPGLADAEQFYLPVGVAGSPLTRFGGGQSLRGILQKIAVTLGFTLFFDVFGVLIFQKFKTPAFSPFIPIFSHVAGDAFTGGSGPGTSEIWSGVYRSSLSEVKNSVTVIGVNALGPLWNPIVAHETDTASIFDDSAPNYKGFHDPMVWADSQFADLGFASAAAANMLAYLRLPAREVELHTWYQGLRPIYPGDLIRVSYPRSGASLVTFFVTGTGVRHAQAEKPTLTISARQIPA